MILYLVVGVVFFGVAVVLAARGVAAGAVKARRNLAQMSAYGFGGQPVAPTLSEGSARDRLDALAGRLGSLVNRQLDREREAELRQYLYAAGLYTLSPKRFMGYRLLATVLFGGGALFLFLASKGNAAEGILFAVAAGGLGWVGPMFVIRRRATARREQMDHDMPEFVDLLVTAVEGGLAFTAALQVASRSIEGPLGQELRLAVQEQTMGLTITEALSSLLLRCDAPAVRSFVQAIVQGELLGVSMGKILRDLAGEMRRRRRQVAEERAHKAGIKIVFPVALLIFPSLFLVTLVPVFVYLVHSLRGG